MKRCSTSLIIREIKIKTTMRYCFVSTRMAIIINKTRANEDVEKRNLPWLVRMSKTAASVEISLVVSQTIELSHDPIILLQDIHPKEWKAVTLSDICKVHSSITHNSQQMEIPKCSLTDEINKRWYITYKRILHNHKNE